MKVSTNLTCLMPVSMIDERQLDMLDEIGQRIRHSQKPFGGLQVSTLSAELISDDHLWRLFAAPACVEGRSQG